MNKKLIYAAIAVIAVIVIRGLVLYINNKTDVPAPVVQSLMSMKDLLANNISQKCTFSNSVAGNESTGTVYTSKGRMRGDFVVKMENGQTIESHMIIADETTYLWSNQMEQGMKIASKMMNDSQGGAQSNGGLDINEKMNYNCSMWSVNPNQFSLPSGVTFTDLSNILPGGN